MAIRPLVAAVTMAACLLSTPCLSGATRTSKKVRVLRVEPGHRQTVRCFHSTVKLHPASNKKPEPSGELQSIRLSVHRIPQLITDTFPTLTRVVRCGPGAWLPSARATRSHRAIFNVPSRIHTSTKA